MRQLPHFKNRKEAAILLAEKLEWLKDVYMESSLTVAEFYDDFIEISVALDNSYHQIVANSDLEKLIEIDHQTISTIYHKDKHNEKS